MSATVEGRIDIDFDESDSSDSEAGDVCSVRPPAAPVSYVLAGEAEDEEEELEVFTAAAGGNSSAAVTTIKTTIKAAPRAPTAAAQAAMFDTFGANDNATAENVLPPLVAMMAKGIQEVEKTLQENGELPPPVAQQQQLPPPPPHEAEASSDGFGIKYQPMARNPTGEAPILIHDADMENIEARLLHAAATSAAAADDDDDEFGVFDDDADEKTGAVDAATAESAAAVAKAATVDSAASAAAVRRALAQVESRYAELEQQQQQQQPLHVITLEELIRSSKEQAAACELLPADRFHAPDEPVLLSTTATDNSSPATAAAIATAAAVEETAADRRARILRDAQLALAGVTEVYSSGLGDQEVRIMSNSNNNKISSNSGNTTSTGAAAAAVGIGRNMAIEEGDEEAAELEESEQAMQERAQQQQLEREKAELTAAFDALDAPSTTAAAAANDDEDSDDEADKLQDISGDDIQRVFVSGSASYYSYMQQREQQQQAVSDLGSPESTFTSFAQALRYFEELDMSAHFPNIVTQSQPQQQQSAAKASISSWFSSGNSSSSGGSQKSLNFAGAQTQLELPFLIAQVDFDPSNPQLRNMLFSVYNFFLENTAEANPSVTGQHWQLLGFQGNDPRTDLNRSMKMLSILQLLHFIENDALLARKLFDMSQSAAAAAVPTTAAERNREAAAAADSSWPFALVAVGFTKEALQALRRGDLNDRCNKAKAVLPVLNDLYSVAFAEFGRLLETQPRVHHAMHLNTLRKAIAADAASFATNVRNPLATALKSNKKSVAAPTIAAVTAPAAAPASAAVKKNKTTSASAKDAAAAKSSSSSNSNGTKGGSSAMEGFNFNDDLQFDSISAMQEVAADAQPSTAAAAAGKGSRFLA